MRKHTFAALFALPLILDTTISHAEIIDHGTYTTDTISGLDWLDVTETINLSRLTVLSETYEGGRYYGWRYATGEEFKQLISNYTQHPYEENAYGAALFVQSLVPLINLLGDTSVANNMIEWGLTYEDAMAQADYYGQHNTLGMIDDCAGDFCVTYPSINVLSRIEQVDAYGPLSFAKVHNAGKYDFEKNSWWGSYLVRNTLVSNVPLPSAYLVFFSGLFALLPRRRKPQI